MRVSSLSNDRIIALVSRHFVPAWISRDRYQMEAIQRDEQLLLGRIDQSRRTRKLEGGAVCVYIVTPEGDTFATLTVQKASKPELLAPFLDKVIRDQKLTARKATADAAVEEGAKGKAHAAKKPRPKSAEGRLFTVRTRFDDKAGPNRGTSRDVVELTREEWSAFLPARGKKSWDIPSATARKLLQQGYPPLPNWDAKQVRVEKASLSARVLRVGGEDGETVVRLEGKLEMTYPYKKQPTDGTVTAPLVGFARVAAGGKKLVSLAVVSQGAKYVWRWQEKPQTKLMSLSIELEQP